MKNKLTMISRLGLTSACFGSLCLAGTLFGQGYGEASKPQPAMPPQQGTAPTQKGIMGMGANPSTTKTSGAISAADKTFMTKAANGNLAEIQWGKWAGQNAKNSDVKSFGNRMVADHTKMYNELLDLAQKKGVQLTKQPIKGKWTDDKAYMAAMVKDHQQDWAEFQNEAKTGADSDLKKWAADSSKMIKSHLDLATKTQSKLK